jgi:hypothetical protein
MQKVGQIQFKIFLRSWVDGNTNLKADQKVKKVILIKLRIIII